PPMPGRHVKLRLRLGWLRRVTLHAHVVRLAPPGEAEGAALQFHQVPRADGARLQRLLARLAVQRPRWWSAPSPRAPERAGGPRRGIEMRETVRKAINEKGFIGGMTDVAQQQPAGEA